MVTDYHLIAGEYLQRFCEALRQQFPNNRFEPFTDNSPVPEVRSALLAGLGRRGKNGLLLHPDYGSYVFIGEVVTDLALSRMYPSLHPTVSTADAVSEPVRRGRCSRMAASSCPAAAPTSPRKRAS